ncbi:hypothetical protein HK105_200302 [Polyrhizophydium stewartii]|uniref:ABC transporter domain-containing protein n=1 Tax=Polyrhizophydium stewartii TaxID=2732419 RepID=A0ABR4NL99_9FUNG
MVHLVKGPVQITGTIEENIVFGDDSVRARIPDAVAAACPDHDLEILPNGLGTQIGEKGINLSGGQKARVALARAIARDADIFLLDDPIAALNAHIGKKVFEDAICGMLRGKTVFLVTHQLHQLPKVDTVVVLDEGRIVETGAFKDLIEIEGGSLVADAVLASFLTTLFMVPLWCDIKTMRGSDFGAATAADDEDKDDDSPHVAHIPKGATLVTCGAVTIRDLEIRYPSRPDHAVIQDLSLDIQPGEKVGVVGRTGSGKLTLMTALFRIMEASKGSIAIDGIDIASLGLKTLRSRLQIIPQEPVLFKGTVRSNLDFATKYTDDELWAALGLVGLKDFVGTLDGKLDAAIEENGANLSMGQRQLMCLCKAILAKPKVLIMDEATASVDAEADRRIQESIETQFAATTVLSIAHRLNTIAAFDRVLVLDGGRIAEFDAPHVRLGRSGSVFGDMVDATGAANAAVIRQIAADHFAVTYRDLASQSFSTIA